jgi:hypothetical protein
MSVASMPWLTPENSLEAGWPAVKATCRRPRPTAAPATRKSTTGATYWSVHLTAVLGDGCGAGPRTPIHEHPEIASSPATAHRFMPSTLATRASLVRLVHLKLTLAMAPSEASA